MFLVNLLLTPYAFILLPILFYLLPYLRNRSTRNIPGPPFAAFSNLWLFYQCRKARRFQAVDHAHKRYGKFVRLQPDHISIADDQAINVVYGHGTGTMKRLVPLFRPFPFWDRTGTVRLTSYFWIWTNK